MNFNSKKDCLLTKDHIIRWKILVAQIILKIQLLRDTLSAENRDIDLYSRSKMEFRSRFT